MASFLMDLSSISPLLSIVAARGNVVSLTAMSRGTYQTDKTVSHLYIKLTRLISHLKHNAFREAHAQSGLMTGLPGGRRSLYLLAHFPGRQNLPLTPSVDLHCSLTGKEFAEHVQK